MQELLEAARGHILAMQGQMINSPGAFELEAQAVEAQVAVQDGLAAVLRLTAAVARAQHALLSILEDLGDARPNGDTAHDVLTDAAEMLGFPTIDSLLAVTKTNVAVPA